VGTSRVLDEDWYTPEASLIDLSYSSPYGNLTDPRSSFGSLLESPLNFDSTNNLISSFRSAPSTLGVQGLGSNRLLEDLACNGQGSSVGLLSSISPGLVSAIFCSTNVSLLSNINYILSASEQSILPA
jgi:hypothetical protein